MRKNVWANFPARKNIENRCVAYISLSSTFNLVVTGRMKRDFMALFLSYFGGNGVTSSLSVLGVVMWSR